MVEQQPGIFHPVAAPRPHLPSLQDSYSHPLYPRCHLSTGTLTAAKPTISFEPGSWAKPGLNGIAGVCPYLM
jgi:hypothetical protein